MKYKIQMRLDGKTPEGKPYPVYYEEVEGEPFTVDGYEEFKFFSRKENGGVIISEVTTGMQIGEWYPGENAANEDTRKRIEKKGVDFVREYIANHKIPEWKTK